MMTAQRTRAKGRSGQPRSSPEESRDDTRPDATSPAADAAHGVGQPDRRGCQNCGHPYERHIFGGTCFFCECQRCVY